MQNLIELRELAKGITVLYVEDNDIARKKTYNLFTKIFKEVHTASNGQDGLALYMKHKFDLVISDIVMAKLNGLEMVISIKQVYKSQRVIFLSSYADINFLTQAIELGVDGFIFKPIVHDKLFDVLYKILMQIKYTRENIQYKTNLEDLVKQRTKELEEKNIILLKSLEEVKKAKYLKEEMMIAQKVQQNFLPKEIPSSNKMQIATHFEAAQFVGGDYYDFFVSSDKAINIVIADVSGHGLGPAINMSSFRGICRAILSTASSFQDQVEHINDMVCSDAKNNSFFITAFFIKFYEKENRIAYIGAGHNDILYYNSKKDSLEHLRSISIPLGIFEKREYQVLTKSISKNDFMVLYTDGLNEAINENQEMYGMNRLTETIKKNTKKTASQLLNSITYSLENFIKEKEKNDDTTILITKFL
ncbi:MAG: SpoIIE family protein phosphatase [Campylobacteraceae bacterium]|nr:SpoIIE family protein phosphatase [Campylobacteraceae bacterium]